MRLLTERLFASVKKTPRNENKNKTATQNTLAKTEKSNKYQSKKCIFVAASWIYNA